MNATSPSTAGGRLLRLVAEEWGTIFFTALALLFFAGAFGLRGQAGFFPMGVSTATALFGLAVLVLALRGGTRRAGAEDEEQEIGWNRRTLLTFAWFGFALAVTYVFGIVVGAAIASIIYFLLLTSVGWIYALINGASFSLFIWIVFQKAAGLPIYSGLLRLF